MNYFPVFLLLFLQSLGRLEVFAKHTFFRIPVFGVVVLENSYDEYD